MSFTVPSFFRKSGCTFNPDSVPSQKPLEAAGKPLPYNRLGVNSTSVSCDNFTNICF